MRILAAAHDSNWATVVLWLGLFAALVVAAVVAIVLIRRAIRAAEQGSEPAFTLQDLREMRDRGDLTEQEYQAARTVALGQTAASTRNEH